jgi:hypothetical protein
MTGPDAPKESDTERDGFLSYAAEWHSFTHGVYDGMRSPKARPGELPEYEDVQEEPHYYKGGYVIGTGVQFVIVGGAGYGLASLAP